MANGLSFKDKDGTERSDCRVKWWQPLNNRKLHKDIMMECPPELVDRPLLNNDYYHYSGDKVVFFGHYWLKGSPKKENNKAICLDYSVAKEGVLVAFKSEFIGKSDLDKGFVY